tara:strand:- start:195011 stop:195511 length:501 start_codon:yes stop_codon:yes gene_type:complete
MKEGFTFNSKGPARVMLSEFYTGDAILGEPGNGVIFTSGRNWEPQYPGGGDYRTNGRIAVLDNPGSYIISEQVQGDTIEFAATGGVNVKVYDGARLIFDEDGPFVMNNDIVFEAGSGQYANINEEFYENWTETANTDFPYSRRLTYNTDYQGEAVNKHWQVVITHL